MALELVITTPFLAAMEDTAAGIPSSNESVVVVGNEGGGRARDEDEDDDDACANCDATLRNSVSAVNVGMMTSGGRRRR